MSEGWNIWAEHNNFGTHWRKENTNPPMDEEDPDNDNNQVEEEQEQFFIPGMEGCVSLIIGRGN